MIYTKKVFGKIIFFSKNQPIYHLKVIPIIGGKNVFLLCIYVAEERPRHPPPTPHPIPGTTSTISVLVLKSWWMNIYISPWYIIMLNYDDFFLYIIFFYKNNREFPCVTLIYNYAKLWRFLYFSVNNGDV